MVWAGEPMESRAGGVLRQACLPSSPSTGCRVEDMPELEGGGGMPSTVIEPRAGPGAHEPEPIPQGYVTSPGALAREHLPRRHPRRP